MDKHFLRIVFLAFLVFFCLHSSIGKAQDKPNIVWITTEDISPNLGCYGDPYAHTPNLDKLAAEGVLYTQAFASAPVCAPARSSIISGMFPTSIGSHHMQTEGRFPEDLQYFPQYLRKAGYYCTNNDKEDYNLAYDASQIWDVSGTKAHWRNRLNESQPFFAIFNFKTTHESRVNDEAQYQEAIQSVPPDLLKKPGEVSLPPYYPDTEAVRELWARYYNNITAMDFQTADILKQLQEDGLADNTIVFFYSER